MTAFPPLLEGIERQTLSQFTERAYLDYSMYVILDRALPYIGDGLKPVQRRIIYAMSELGLSAGSKHKKSARTIGDVLGKFHPHGDSACYEAMVLMAQPFAYRYPLVDGQGNWGSQDDPKSFAAMRYTEARLSPFAKVLLRELGQGTVDWVANFDGTLDEPKLLPSRLPHVLLNGTTGIAVGMATDIPPHNLRELVQACAQLLENPSLSLDALCEIVHGPDYPSAGEIVSSADEIRAIYATGHGSIRMRAVYEHDAGDIVVTALPHQVSGAKVLEQIARQMHAKKLPIVEDLRDESDHENPTRLVICPRGNRVDSDALMSHLFATTDLERSYRVNLNMIGVDGRPQVKPLKPLLLEWLGFRTASVRRRLQWQLEKVEKRLHILAGLLIAFLNLDEFIAIIRAEDEPKPVLMARFGIDDRQAEAILELKLRHLAKLEEVRIRDGQVELAAERDQLSVILGSERRLKTLIKNELCADAALYGDERRSPIVRRAAARALRETDLTPSEAVTVILSQRGWARCAKGHEVDPAALNYKSGDSYQDAAIGKSNWAAMFLDSSGRVYSLPAHTLPSARGLGEPLSGRLKPADGANFVATLMGEEEDRYLFSTTAGYGFICRLGELYSRNRSGKVVLSVPAGVRVSMPTPVAAVESDLVVAINAAGYMLAFPVAELPELSRGKGSKIIAIAPGKYQAGEESMCAIAVVSPGEVLRLYSGKRHIRLRGRDIEVYHGRRGKRGLRLPRGFRSVQSMAIET